MAGAPAGRPGSAVRSRRGRVRPAGGPGLSMWETQSWHSQYGRDGFGCEARLEPEHRALDQVVGPRRQRDTREDPADALQEHRTGQPRTEREAVAVPEVEGV